LIAAFSINHLIVPNGGDDKDANIDRYELFACFSNTKSESELLEKDAKSSSQDHTLSLKMSAMNQVLSTTKQQTPSFFLDYANRDYRKHGLMKFDQVSEQQDTSQQQHEQEQQNKVLDEICAIQFGTKDFYRAAIVPPQISDKSETNNKLNRQRRQLFTLVSRYLGENIHIRYLLEYATGYYTSMMNLDSHVVTFTVNSILNTTIHPNHIPMCTSNDGNESEALRTFLIQTDMKHIRLSLDVVNEREVMDKKRSNRIEFESQFRKTRPSSNNAASGVVEDVAEVVDDDHTVNRVPIEQSSSSNSGPTIPMTSMGVKERTVMDAYIKPIKFHRSLVCNPITHHPKYSSVRAKFKIDRLLVLYHDPFYSMWSQIYSKPKFQQLLSQQGENQNQMNRKIPKWQEFAQMPIISELSNALSVLSPLHMPLYDGKFRGYFADKPVPSFPGKQALVFSYESIIYSLIPHGDSPCNPMSANDNSSHHDGRVSGTSSKFLWNSLCQTSDESATVAYEKNPFHKLMRYVERYVDLDIASRVPMIGYSNNLAETLLAAEKWREKKGMPNIARSLTGEELVSRGQCAYAMLLTHKDLPSRFKLVELEEEFRLMKVFYRRYPMYKCEVYALLESKLPLLYQHMIMIYDADDLEKMCKKKTK
jgi:hypothetical protein